MSLFSAKNTVLALIENVCVYYTKLNTNTPLVNRLQKGVGGGVNNLLKTEKDKQKEKEKNTKDIYLYIN